VNGISGNIYQGFNTYEEALSHYLAMKVRGRPFCQVVRNLPEDTDDIWGTAEEATM